MANKVMAPEEALAMQAPAAGRVAIVLEPLTHPELGQVAIDDSLFAIGRTEQPFAAYPPDIVADLSRRHARIFIENGGAWLADLDSKNGTTVNGAPVRQAIVRLRDGDEVDFARVLAYRVRLQDAAPASRPPPARLASLSLTPERAELGLETIVITSFPFLISKVDDTFARYKDKEPHQVGYLSRRHAHIFIKGGLPWVEDLGSTNGTFIGAVRLDEHAQALEDGDVLAFGGHHFVYRVGLVWEQPNGQTLSDPTVTRVSFSSPSPAGPAAADGEADHTTFVASAGSFLDIFCVDRAAAQEDEVNPAEPPSAGQEPGKRPRSKAAMMAAGLLDALGAAGDADRARLRRWMAVLGALALVLVLVVYRAGAPQRELQALLDSGEVAAAGALAADQLARDPDNAELRALGTEALLRSALPPWMAHLKAKRYGRAAQAVANMRTMSRHNADAMPLVAEIAWIGEVEQFVTARGGAGVPIRNPADGARIRQILRQWQDGQQAHQRAFATISSTVPAFRDTYAQAVSDLRKLALAGESGGAANGNDQ
jgi:pSer/pThr/pTyr-binding forkhead associated (FHA) protein